MARPRSKMSVTCPNSRCKYHQTEDGKNIIKKGKNRAGHQQYFCGHCRKYFVETAATPLYRKHLSEGDIVKICKLLVEKKSIRSIERTTGHHRDTICRLLENIAENVDGVNDLLTRRLSESEVHEMWKAIRNNKRTLSAEARRTVEQLCASVYMPKEESAPLCHIPMSEMSSDNPRHCQAEVMLLSKNIVGE